MKKKIFLILALVVSVGGYLYRKSSPEFSGPYARFHEAVWKYRHTNDAEKKYVISREIYHIAVSRERFFFHQNDLSNDDHAVIDEVRSFVDATISEQEDFFSELVPTDIDFITRENPDSFFRTAHVLLLGDHKLTCSNEQMKLIEAKMGAFFASRIVALQEYVRLHDEPYSKGYYQKIIELIRTDDRFNLYQDLAEVYYRGQIQLTMPYANVDEQIKRAEAKLVATGLKIDQVKDYAYKLATEYPGCLAEVNEKINQQPVTAQ